MTNDEIDRIVYACRQSGDDSTYAIVRAALAAPAQPIGFDHKTAANLLNGKTVTEEEVRRFVACSRWAHDDRDGLRNAIADLRREIAQRDAEIALLKTSLLDAEAPTQAAQALDADLWYLQDTRSYVGNDVVWWAKDGKGYTTDVSKAHVYGREEAFRQAAMRGTDRAWPKAYIDGNTRPAVDMQYIDHAAAIAAQKGGANAS